MMQIDIRVITAETADDMQSVLYELLDDDNRNGYWSIISSGVTTNNEQILFWAYVALNVFSQRGA